MVLLGLSKAAVALVVNQVLTPSMTVETVETLAPTEPLVLVVEVGQRQSLF